jgi:hypothetical protein
MRKKEFERRRKLKTGLKKLLREEGYQDKPLNFSDEKVEIPKRRERKQRVADAPNPDEKKDKDVPSVAKPKNKLIYRKTKKGQPVLSNLVDYYLKKIQQ